VKKTEFHRFNFSSGDTVEVMSTV